MSEQKIYHLFDDDDMVSVEYLHKLDKLVEQGEMVRRDHFVTFEELDRKNAEIDAKRIRSKHRLSGEELRKKIAENKERLLNGKDD